MKKIILLTLCFLTFFCSAVCANELMFEPVGGGKFIYCNNPEGIWDDILINGDIPRWIMNNENLTADTYYIYLSHFNYTGSGKIGYDIELDMAMTAKEDSTVTIHKAFFETPQNYAYYENWNRTVAETDWGQLQVCADMLGIPMCDIRGKDFYYPRDFEPVTLDIKAGETVWLSEYLDGYQPIPFVKAVHIQGLIEIESGKMDFNVGALKSGRICGDRENIPENIAFGEYRWDYTLKGVADTLPETKTDIEYTINEETEDGTRIPVFLKNQYIPEGHTVTAWYTQLNPQNDIWSKTTAAESDILPLYYKDDTKLGFYGSGVDESEKNNVWQFDTYHSGVRKYEARFNTGKESEFEPNFILSTETDNHAYSCNIGNYGVATTYRMKITNETNSTKYCSLVITAASEVIGYETDANGNKAPYAYVKDLTGEKVTDNMLSHEIQPNSTEEFEFSLILPVNYNGGIKNELVITDENIQAVDFKEKEARIAEEKKNNDYRITDVIYGEPLNEAVGNPPEQLAENAQNYEYLQGREISLARWCVWDGAPDWYYNLWNYIGGVYILDKDNEIINAHEFPSLPCGASYADEYFYIKTARDGVYKSKDGEKWEKTDETLPEYVPFYNLDMASDWAVSELETGWDLGIRLRKHTKNGYNFKSNITREEFCELLLTMPNVWNFIRECYTIEKPEMQKFEDTLNPDIELLAAMEIIKGFGDGTFRPKDMLTREQAAVILARVAELFAEDAEKYENHIYEDNSIISEWAAEAVDIVYNLGIMHGVGDNFFDPQGAYSREQSAATVLRLYEYIW